MPLLTCVTSGVAAFEEYAVESLDLLIVFGFSEEPGGITSGETAIVKTRRMRGEGKCGTY